MFDGVVVVVPSALIVVVAVLMLGTELVLTVSGTRAAACSPPLVHPAMATTARTETTAT
jgi:hypothetical protein